MRASVLATDESGKSFLARGRINERRRHRRDRGETKDAERAALLIFLRLRRMLTAVLRFRFLFHLGATATSNLLGRDSRWDGCETERNEDRQADQKP